MNNNKFTTALFHNKESAEQAYNHAIERGYQDKDINVLMSEESRKKYYDSDLVKDNDSKAVKGLGVGSAVGGVVGGIVGAIAAMGTSLVIPGLGLIIAGPLAAGLAGAGAGGLSGGLIGTLVGWGIPEEKAKEYESGIQSGGIILGVNEHLSDSNLENGWKNYNRS